jgi:hypothetical protein
MQLAYQAAPCEVYPAGCTVALHMGLEAHWRVLRGLSGCGWPAAEG